MILANKTKKQYRKAKLPQHNTTFSFTSLFIHNFSWCHFQSIAPLICQSVLRKTSHCNQPPLTIEMNEFSARCSHNNAKNNLQNHRHLPWFPRRIKWYGNSQPSTSRRRRIEFSHTFRVQAHYSILILIENELLIKPTPELTCISSSSVFSY